MVIFQQNRIPVSLPKTLTWEDFMSEEMMERALHADDIQVFSKEIISSIYEKIF